MMSIKEIKKFGLTFWGVFYADQQEPISTHMSESAAQRKADAYHTKLKELKL